MWSKKWSSVLFNLHALFADPAVQAAVLPFIVALVLCYGLSFIWQRGLLLGSVGGFLAAVYVISGLNLVPLNATNKVILLGLLAIPLSILLEFLKSTKGRSLVLTGVALAAIIWVFWPVLSRQTALQNLFLVAISTLYLALVLVLTSRLWQSPVFGSSLSLQLAVASGGVALLGATALYAQLGFALAAVLGAYLLVVLLRVQTQTVGPSLNTQALALNLWIGIIPPVAHVYASLPWYTFMALLAMLIVPLFLAEKFKRNPWVLLVWSVLLALPGFCAAFYLTWRVTGTPPL